MPPLVAAARDLTVVPENSITYADTIWFPANRTPHHRTCGVQTEVEARAVVELQLPPAIPYACGVTGLPDRDDGGVSFGVPATVL